MHDIKDWLALGEFGISLLAAPAVHLLWKLNNEISALRVTLYREFVTKEELREHQCKK